VGNLEGMSNLGYVGSVTGCIASSALGAYRLYNSGLEGAEDRAYRLRHNKGQKIIDQACFLSFCATGLLLGNASQFFPNGPFLLRFTRGGILGLGVSFVVTKTLVMVSPPLEE
jgi:hypothetical protein